MKKIQNPLILRLVLCTVKLQLLAERYFRGKEQQQQQRPIKISTEVAEKWHKYQRKWLRTRNKRCGGGSMSEASEQDICTLTH